MAIYCTEHERHEYEERGYWRCLPELIPAVTFQTRVYDATRDQYDWKSVTTWDLFSNRRVLLFSLPGAFTPTCSTYQLPSFEQLAPEFYDEGIDAIYCFTVNDAFVCNAWAGYTIYFGIYSVGGHLMVVGGFFITAITFRDAEKNGHLWVQRFPPADRTKNKTVWDLEKEG